MESFFFVLPPTPQHLAELRIDPAAPRRAPTEMVEEDEDELTWLRTSMVEEDRGDAVRR